MLYQLQKMKRILNLLIFVLFIGCNTPVNQPEKIYDTYRKSVVLIKNEYYYKILFGNDLDLYFIIKNNEPVFLENRNEAIEDAMLSFGTGFFVDEKGKIATNKHVVFPTTDKIDLGKNISSHLSSAKKSLKDNLSDLYATLSKIQEFYNEYGSSLGYSEKEELIDKYSAFEKEITEIELVYNLLDFDESIYKVSIEWVSLGIVYDDTFVDNFDEFYPCVPVQSSNEYDLALIQLKNKSTPENVLPISLNKASNLKLNEDVFMIGFNHGISLALTDDGIKSQFNSGKISRDPTNNQILYSIPSLSGSSGSPVFNGKGELVAINYAGIKSTQSFNFGIPVNHLYSLYESGVGYNNELSVSNSPPKSSKKPEESTVRVTADYSEIIENFLKAEEVQNFKKIREFYSSDVSRYWDVNYPTMDDIFEHYQKSWRIIESPKNEITGILKLNESNYRVMIDFKYYHLKKMEWMETKSIIRIKFDDKGKIVEIFGE